MSHLLSNLPSIKLPSCIQYNNQGIPATSGIEACMCVLQVKLYKHNATTAAFPIAIIVYNTNAAHSLVQHWPSTSAAFPAGLWISNSTWMLNSSYAASGSGTSEGVLPAGGGRTCQIVALAAETTITAIPPQVLVLAMCAPVTCCDML